MARGEKADTIGAMKEKVTIRLYEDAARRACCELDRYCPGEKVTGWNYQRGQQIELLEREGGFLMASIDHIGNEVLRDSTGRYKLADVWTLD